MRRDRSLPVALLALLVAGAAAVKAFLPAADAPTEPGRAAASAGLAQLEERVARLEGDGAGPRLSAPQAGAPLAALSERLARFEARLDSLEAAAAARQATPAPGVDLRDLGDDELLARARGLAEAGRGSPAPAADALQAWQEVLRRTRSEAVRREALLACGFAHRALKQHDREEEMFREVLRSPGADAKEVQWAQYQLAWAQNFRGDLEGARDSMADLVRSGQGPRELAGHARLYEAEWSLALEDPTRARVALEGIVREFGESSAPGSAWLVEQAHERLRRLDRR